MAALVVLPARPTRVSDWMPIVPRLLALLPTLQPGTITHVDAA